MALSLFLYIILLIALNTFIRHHNMDACSSPITSGLNKINASSFDDSDEYQQAQCILQDFHRMHGQPSVIIEEEEEEECRSTPRSSRGLIKSQTHMCLTELLQSSSSDESDEDGRDEGWSQRPMQRNYQLVQYRFQKQAAKNLKYTSCSRRRRHKMRLNNAVPTFSQSATTSSC